MAATGSGAAAGRATFVHEGRDIYEWEQSLDEVLVYFKTPPGVKAAHIDCAISSGHVRLGLKGAPPFLDEGLSCLAVARDSFWNKDGEELTLTLTKARKGETWLCVFKGHGALDASATAEVHRSMLLERFGAEHPGFDFSGAAVNGAVPDPRTFMGGVRHT